jgi:hypothetical protein
MGTRSLTYIRETEKSAAFLCIYRQFDGYPSGMGKDLYNILKGYTIVNGFSMDDSACIICGEQKYVHNSDVEIYVKNYPKAQGHSFESKRVANGINDLAGTIVKNLKDGIGGIYIYNPRTKDAGQEFVYDLYMHKGILTMKVSDSESKVLYTGSIDEFDTFTEETGE